MSSTTSVPNLDFLRSVAEKVLRNSFSNQEHTYGFQKTLLDNFTPFFFGKINPFNDSDSFQMGG